MNINTRPLPGPFQGAIANVFPRGGHRAISKERKRLALAVGAASDLAQWIFFPVLAEGALSPFEIALDVATAFVILLIVGFQWRLAIALLAELIPGVDLFPTWTAVVWSLPTAPDVQ